MFCDANTSLNKNALINIARHYADASAGGVAGEKRVGSGMDTTAAASGEGAYWRYESALKKWDAELATVVGAAGELFSVRTTLYEAVPADIIIEDFYLSMRVVEKGYRVVYEPEAYARELGSVSIKEEGKRKIRMRPEAFRQLPVSPPSGTFFGLDGPLTFTLRIVFSGGR